ncbi:MULTISPECIES: hypothetical protein [unclassified Sinorhizobium]|uniref:hypothetical protein n=1 Tax=unclassified Sinorhizobium TaxID=2613772 RepID=UPI0035234CD3
MFFLGGMTMGYLHPPAPAEEAVATSTKAVEEKNRRLLVSREASLPRDGRTERPLIWAWRILC